MAATTVPGLERYRAAVEEELRQAVNGELPLYHLMRYHLGWVDPQGRPTEGSGKALRPALCLWSCWALGGVWQRALPAAAAIELIHNFSLAHDDIQDGDRERRHRPTLWHLWDRPRALATGTGLWALAYRLIDRLREPGLPSYPTRPSAWADSPAEVSLSAYRLINEGVLDMIEGQCLDISYEGRLDVSVEAYLDMVEKKTGALLGCAMALGALLANDSDEDVQAFRRCGRLLGLAFQARDDILGIWGEEERTGKPRASDVRQRKKSLPVVYALERAQGQQRRALLEIYSQDEVAEEQIAAVLAVLDSVGALPLCQEMAASYARQALRALDGRHLASGALAELEEIVAFLLEREF